MAVVGRTLTKSVAGKRLAGASLIALSLLAAAVCAVLLAAWIPSDVERYEDYGEAGPCPGEAAAGAWEDCLREVSFTVTDTVVRSAGRSSEYAATLSGAPFWNGTVGFGGPGPLLRQLEPGDEVTGTVWRGDVMTLSRGGIEQGTSSEPRDEPQIAAATASFAGLLAVVMSAFGAGLLARTRDMTPLPWKFLMGLIAISGLISWGVGFSFLLLGVPWPLVPVTVALLAALVAWGTYRRISTGRHPR